MHWTAPDTCHICTKPLDSNGACSNCEQDRRNGN